MFGPEASEEAELPKKAAVGRQLRYPHIRALSGICVFQSARIEFVCVIVMHSLSCFGETCLWNLYEELVSIES